MKRLFVALSFALILSGCGLTADQRALVRQQAIDAIEQWNAAGVDPLKASPEVVAAMQSTCAIATVIITVINPSMPSLGPTGLDFCIVVSKAVGRGTPLETVEPVEE